MVRQDGTGNPKSRRYWRTACILWAGLFGGLAMVPAAVFGMTGWARFAASTAILGVGLKWFIMPSFLNYTQFIIRDREDAGRDR